MNSPANSRKPTSPTVVKLALEMGFDLCGVTTPLLDDCHSVRFGSWLKNNFHGQMDYMEETAAKRNDITLSFPEVKSVIVVAMNYYQQDNPERPAGTGRVARYARGRDYHRIFETRLKKMVRELCQNFPALDAKRDFRLYVDYGPILERAYAEKAGLGFIGKNTLLITPEYGSWVLLAVILTTMELAPSRPRRESLPDCGSCERCLIHCPTGAIIAPRMVDARKCISYLTIESSEEIPEEYLGKLDGRVFGCDICQEVCPYNNQGVISHTDDFSPDEGVGEFINLKETLKMETREKFLELTEGTPLTRPKLAGLQRNSRAILAGDKRTSLSDS